MAKKDKPSKPRSSLIRDLWSGKYSMRVVQDKKKEAERKRSRKKGKRDER